MSQIKFAPPGRRHDGAVGEQEQRNLEEKAHFLCITVSFLRVYSGVTPTPLLLFKIFFLLHLPHLVLAAFLTQLNLKVLLLLLPLRLQSNPVY